MRTYKTGVAGVFLAGATALFLSAVSADSGYAQATKGDLDSKSTVEYASVEGALRQGIGAYRAGRLDIALGPLEYAARNNNLLAMLVLARLHSGRATGLSAGQRDVVKAYKYYQHIADNLVEVRYPDRHTKVASEAFLALAEYNRDGLPEAKVKPNEEAAVKLYQHAAIYYQDPVAEYLFASAFQNGKGVEKNLKHAARWFFRSATKNYAPSQAMLGIMYWNGQGVDVNKAQAFALLKLAMHYAGKKDQEWIKDHYERVAMAADGDMNSTASQLVAIWERQFGVSPYESGMMMARGNQREDKNTASAKDIASKEDQSDGKLPFIRVEPVNGKDYITAPAALKPGGGASFRNLDETTGSDQK